MPSCLRTLSVGARHSPLSQAQAKEVLDELKIYHPNVDFYFHFIPAHGDRDLKTSLRTLSKTDFFTREIDQMILNGDCRLGIHSAKDLPDPLPEGIAVVALTKGIDPSDSLVMREGQTLHLLPSDAVIATSSERREEVVKSIRSDLRFVDIRGNIGQRLARLESKEVDGVVVAEAALIRLGLIHLNRMALPGPAAQYQGQLAVTAHAEDGEMDALFSCIDSRPVSLHVGLESPPPCIDKRFLHRPLIKIQPREPTSEDILHAFQALADYTHFIFTSKSAVRIFFDYFKALGCRKDVLDNKCIIAVGQATAGCLRSNEVQVNITAKKEQAEGIIEELEGVDLTRAHIFWPHSALSRPILADYFHRRAVKYTECVLYDTIPSDLDLSVDFQSVDEIIFTSPSTVDAFLVRFKEIPADKRLICKGSITEQYLANKFNSPSC